MMHNFNNSQKSHGIILGIHTNASKVSSSPFNVDAFVKSY